MSGKRLYSLDENVFDRINTDEKAYWLGFIYADGYVKTKSQSLLSVKLASKDKEHLEKLAKFFSTDKPLLYREVQTKYGLAKSYQLDICSKNVVNNLINKGCVNNKSLILDFPTKTVPKKHLNAFIRGYFDGDGSVFISNLKKNNKVYRYLGINVCGTREFLEGLSKIIFGKVMCIYKEKRRSTNTWNFKLAGNKRSLVFLNYIYKDSTVHLDRKKAIAP